jgi:poly-gamma-glutamate synthesis protein (capsule biosynthesis protein)
LPPRRHTTLLAGGDVALNRASGRGAFGALAQRFGRAGAAFFNLELPLSERGEPQPEKILLRGSPRMADALTEARMDFLSLANNHILDYGNDALADTLALLKSRGIPTAGAGPSLRAARRAAVIERGGLRIGLLAFSSIIPRAFAAGPEKSGLNPLRALTAYRPSRDLSEYPGTPPEIRTWADPADLGRMKRDIRALKKRVDTVIVNHHWGTSMNHAVQDFQSEIGRASVDAGADLVLGGHAHVLQGVEFYRGRPIVYSMGNLIFDFDIPFFTKASRQAFLFGCRLTKAGAEAPYLIPCASGDFEAPRILSPARGAGRGIAGLMARLSEPLGAKFRASGARLLVRPL